MGQDICGGDGSEAREFLQQRFEFQMGQDNAYPGIEHTEQIPCYDPHILQSLRHCEELLRESSKLYKDPTVRTDPLVLKALESSDSEVKCTYERPWEFLSELGGSRVSSYKLWAEEEGHASDVVVRDEVLQYFGAFLCYVAEQSHLLKDILLTGPNNYGIAAVRVKVGPKHESVFIDDYVLCHDKRPLFAQPVRGIYMWPCLLEKAWLKVKGNTGRRIEKADPEDVFNAFLSLPIRYHPLPHHDRPASLELLSQELWGLRRPSGCVVTTRREPPHKIGISGRKHLYLLGVVEWEGRRLYYLRNPCGALDFRGTHRIPSNELGRLLKEATGEFQVAEGNVVLEEDEFLEQIEGFLVVHYEKGASVVSEEQIFVEPNEEFFIRTELRKESPVSIAFHQTSLQASQHLCHPVTYQVVALAQQRLVSDPSNNQGCFGVRTTHMLPGVTARLPPGEYLIRILKKPLPVRRGQGATASPLGDQIVVTASEQVKFDYKQATIAQNQFQEFLAWQGREQLRAKREGSLGGRGDVEEVGFWLGDLVVIYVERTNPHKPTVRVEVSFGELLNLRCLSHAQLGKDWESLEFRDSLLIYFEKVELAGETRLGKYSVEAY